MPRDVDPAVHALDGCYLYDIDDLEAVVSETLAGRRVEAELAERLVVEETERFREWRASLDVVPAISSLRAHAEAIRAAELAKLSSLPEEERRRLEAVTAQILNKLLHEPTVRMKEAAAQGGGTADARGDPAPVRARGRAVGVLVRIGSRGSRLALAQAELAGEVIRRAGHEVAFVPITTAGDRDRTSPFGQIGERGVFVKEIEEALLAGRIDVAVHSAKDMTSTDTAGLAVGAYLERDDPRDALVGADALTPGMRIGTASVRRRAQLLAFDPSISVEPLRGNIDTRLRKARERGLDALILASCGLDRLGLAGEIGLRLPAETMLPEAAQGALALQVRAGEEELAAAGDSPETRRRVEAERACVAAIGGGCLAPVAAHHDGARLSALIADVEGRWIERRTGDDPEALAAELLGVAEARAA